MTEPLRLPDAPGHVVAEAARARTAGIGLMVLAVSMFPVMDAMAKYLGQSYHVAEVVWARYVFHLAVVAALFARRGALRHVTSRHPRLQLARATLLLAATSLFFTALTYIPLANAIAINFIAPFLVVLFSIPMLGERVEWQRWVVMGVAFAAALLIIKPGLGGFNWASLLVCLSASCYAIYQIITRRLAAIDHPYTTLLYTGVVGAALTSAVAPFVWTPPSLAAWALMAMMGILGGLSHFCLIHAYRHAAASTLAPFSYTQIAVGIAIGYLWFGHFPDRLTIAGVAVIVGCGLYLVFSEARRP